MYGANFRPEDELEIQRRSDEEFRQANQVRDLKVLTGRNRKVFRHGVSKYIVQSSNTDISVMTESGLQLVDLIRTTHPSMIQCLDIADLTKDIVSFSHLVLPNKGEVSKLLVVHGLSDQSHLITIDSKVTRDEVMAHKDIHFQMQNEQHLKWREYWRCDLTLPSFVNCISLTPQGDAFALSGNEFLTLWTRDTNLSAHSFTMNLFYATKLPENLYAHCVDTIPDLGQIFSSEFTADSRTLVTLEQNNETKTRKVRVWYNKKVSSLQERMPKPFISNKVRMNDGDTFFNVAITDLDKLDHVSLEFNPRGKFTPSSIYALPFAPSLFSKKEIQPASFCVLSESTNKAQLWVESLVFQPEVPFSFYCAHTFVLKRGLGRDPCFDICMLSLDMQENPTTYKRDRITTSSRMLDPLYSDYVSLAKQQQEEKIFGNTLNPNLNGKTSQDFLMMLCNQELNIFSVQGLRNYPQRHIEVQHAFKIVIPMQNLLGRRIQVQSLVEAGTDCFLKGSHSIKDTIKLTCVTTTGEMVQFSTKNLSDQDISSKELMDVTKIQGNNVYEQSQQSHGPVCYHPTLPLEVHLANQNQLVFSSLLVETPFSLHVQNGQHLMPNQRFIHRYFSDKKITTYCWVPQTALLLVLKEDDSIDLLAATSYLEILKIQSCENKSPADFAKIWKKHTDPNETRFIRVAKNIIGGQDFPLLGIEVLGVYFQSKNQEQLTQLKFGLVTFKQSSVQIYEATVTNFGSKDSIETSAELLATHGCKDRVRQVLSTWSNGTTLASRTLRECQPYLAPKFVLKAMLLVKNSESMVLDVMMIEASLTFESGPTTGNAAKVSVWWQKELPSQDKRVSTLTSSEEQQLDYSVSAHFNDKLMGLCLLHRGKKEYTLYLYDHSSHFKYVGFLDLLDFIDFHPHDKSELLKVGFPIDLCLPTSKSSLLLITCLNRVFVIGWNGSIWSTVKTVDAVSSLDIRLLTELQLRVSPQGQVSVLINNQQLVTTSEYLAIQGTDLPNPQTHGLAEDEDLENHADAANQKKDKRGSHVEAGTQTLAQLNLGLSESKTLHNVEVLKELFVNGKQEFVMKVLIQLNSAIAKSIKDHELLLQSSPSRIHGKPARVLKPLHLSNIVNFSLQKLLSEISSFVEAQTAQAELSNTKDNKQKPKKAAAFDDFFGEDDDDSDGVDLMDLDSFSKAKPKKKAEPVAPSPQQPAQKPTEQKFLEIFEELLTNIVRASDLKGDTPLIDFILVFRSIFAKDFSSDTMASNLMRQVFLETEEPDRSLIENLQLQSGKQDEDEGRVKKLAAHEIYAQMYGEDSGQKYTSSAALATGAVDISKLIPWNSRKAALALFTTNQDVIMDELKMRFDLENNASWATVKKLSMAVWVKDAFKLRLVVDWITKVAFREAGEQQLKSTGTGAAPASKAEATSLWYLLLNKKQALIDLYEKEKATGGDKVAQMLSQDFTAARWKTAATKNAMVLRQKQRYLLSATFFLLADDYTGALQILRRSMNDPQLAILALRLMQLQQPNNTKLQDYIDEVYDEDFIQRGKNLGDNYLVSIGYWGKKQYVAAVNHLQTKAEGLNYQQGVEHFFEKEATFDVSKRAATNTSDEYLPVVTLYSGLELVEMINRVQKAPRVVDALKGNNAATAYGADEGDIFADFGAAASNKAKAREPEKKVELDINQTLLVSQMLRSFLSKRDALLSLFLIRENRTAIEAGNKEQVALIQQTVQQILLDQTLQARHDESYLFRHEGSISSQAGALVDFALGADDQRVHLGPDKLKEVQIVKAAVKQQVQFAACEYLKQLQGCQINGNSDQNPMFIHEIDLRMNASQTNPVSDQAVVVPSRFNSLCAVMARLEQKTMDLASFIFANTNQVNLTNFGMGTRVLGLQQQRRVLVDMETVVECLILFSHHEPQYEESSLSHKDIVDYFTNGLQTTETKKPKQAPKAQAAPKPSFDMFDGFGEESSDGPDLMDLDFAAPPKKPNAIAVKTVQVSLVEEEPTSPRKLSDQELTYNEAVLDFNRTVSLLQGLCFQVKATLVLYLSIFVMATQVNKFGLCRDILDKQNLEALLVNQKQSFVELESRLNTLRTQLKRMGQSGEFAAIPKIRADLANLQATLKAEFDNFHFQNIKTQVQKFKFYTEELLQDLQPAKDADSEHENEEDTIEKKAPSFVEEWQRELQSGIDEAQAYETDPDLRNKNETKLTVGLLFKLGFLRPESYVFAATFLRLQSFCKCATLLIQSIDQTFGFNSFQKQQLLEDSPCNRSRKLSFLNLSGSHDTAIFNASLELDIHDLQKAMLGQQLVPQRLFNHFKLAMRQLEDECTVFFSERLTTLSRQFLARIFCPVKTQASKLHQLLLSPFFKTQQKMEAFLKAVRIEDDSRFFTKMLNEQYLGLLGRGCSLEQDEHEILDQETPQMVAEFTVAALTAQSKREKSNSPGRRTELEADMQCDSATSQAVRDLFWTGVELFKQRSEQISDFAFDNTDSTNNIAVGLMTSGCREIPAINTLLFRNRIENGLQLIDDENLTWEECLHRYDELERIMYGGLQASPMYPEKPEFIPSKDEAIISLIDSTYSYKTLTFRSKALSTKKIKLADRQFEPCLTWNNRDSSVYLSQLSKLEITHDDYTYAVESHPHLPMYVTGNRRGIICSWKFNQTQDKSLSQFMPEVDPRVADAKRACIKKIAFNNYGDRLMSLNFEGSFSMYQMDYQSRQMRKIPIFSLYEGVDMKISDFDLVNTDNVICAISQKKVVKVYDTLLPHSYGKQSTVMEVRLKDSQSNGNLILFNKAKQNLYAFNGRLGSMVEMDLRKNLQVVSQFQLSKSEEITAVCLNQAGDTLITGYKDGTVKIHSLDMYYEKPTSNIRSLRLKEYIDAFPLSQGKKGTVQKIKINPKTGGLYAGSQSGILKLLRPRV